MKYTYQYVLENRYDKKANPVRKMGDKYVIMTVISKACSPVPVYLFLNLGLHPDTITLVSLFFIVLSAACFILGSSVWAVVFLLCFALLDSVDGDMARCKGPTKYGAIFDSFGADLFYAVVPLSVGFCLVRHNIFIGTLSSMYTLLISALVSLSFILYRLINIKVLNFRNGLKIDSGNHSEIAKDALKSKGAVRLLEWYRHVLLRGNFFAEPGLIFWFSILVLAGAYKILGWYLIIILVYNLGYLFTNFVGMCVFFKSLDKKTTEEAKQ